MVENKESDLRSIDFSLENIDETDGKLYFTAKSITDDFVCEAGRKRMASNSTGKPLIWRHEHPIQYKNNHIFGEVVESNYEGNSIISKYEVYDHTKDHKKFIKILKDRHELGEPLSISMRFRTYYNELGDPVHFDVIEHSATPTPACKECVVIDIKNEDEKMPEEENIKEEIEKLESELTKKDKILEKLEEETKELKEKLSFKDEELEKTKESKDEFAGKLDEFKDKLLEQKTIIDKLQEARKMDKLMPTIENILEYPTEGMMEDVYLELAKNKEFKEAKEFFDKKLESLKKASKVMAVTKSMSSTAQDAFDEESLESDPEKEKAAAKKAFKHSPELFKKLYGDK